MINLKQIPRCEALVAFSLLVGVLSLRLPLNLNIIREYPLRLDYSFFYMSGLSAQAKGKFSEAIVYFNNAYKIAKREDSFEKGFFCVIKLGILRWNQGNIQESYQIFKQADAFIFENNRIDERSNITNILNLIDLYLLAKSFREFGDEKKSIEYFNNAISLARDIDGEEFELKCLRQLGICFLQMRNYKAFQQCNISGLAIAQKLNHKIEEARCLNNIGIYYEKFGEISKALEYFEKAIITANLENDKECESDSLNNIALVYREIGEHEKAIDILGKAFAMDIVLENYEDASIALANIGSTYIEIYKITRNKTHLFRAHDNLKKSINFGKIKINSSCEIAILNNIGIVLEELGKFNQAEQYFEYALEKSIGDIYKEERSVIFSNLAGLYFKYGNKKKAIEYYRNSIALSKEVHSTLSQWETFFGMAQCLEEKGEINSAINYYKKAIEEIETTRKKIHFDIYKSGFLQNKYVVYRKMVNLLYKGYLQNKSRENLEIILNYVEKAKARAFLDSIIGVYLDNVVQPDVNQKEKAMHSSREIAIIQKYLFRKDYSSNQKKILLEQPERAEEGHLNILTNRNMENLVQTEQKLLRSMWESNEWKKTLTEKSAILEYWLDDRQSILFYIEKSKIEIIELSQRQDIEDILRGYLKNLATTNNIKHFNFSASKKVANKLLDPIINCISKDINNLVIVPDGILHYLPFESLRLDENNNSFYLIEKYEVSYALSITVLAYCQQKKISVKKKYLLAIGAPKIKEIQQKTKISEDDKNIFNTSLDYLNKKKQLLPIPYSKKEINIVSGYYKRDERDIYVGEKASESNIKSLNLSNYRIIHFACHGILDEIYPTRSALILACNTANYDDGLLQVREIYRMQIHVDLVVLSSCQTGSGRLDYGEGTLSIMRSFFCAGAKSVICTLWRVNDSATVLFMKYFHMYLSEGQEKAAAIRLAKLKMLLSNKSHPHYWAGFLLNGDYATYIN